MGRMILYYIHRVRELRSFLVVVVCRKCGQPRLGVPFAPFPSLHSLATCGFPVTVGKITPIPPAPRRLDRGSSADADSPCCLSCLFLVGGN
jgi:hypothetical protein